MAILGAYEENERLNIYNLNNAINDFKKIKNGIIFKQEKLLVCLIDIMNFRFYNYTYGYKYGDIILNKFIQTINRYISTKGKVYRFCGDKLIILMPIYDKEYAEKIVNEIFNLSNRTYFMNNKKVNMNFRAGISLYPDDSKDIYTILKYAEIAVNYAKKITKKNYEFFKSYMYENAIVKEKISNNIHNALKNNEFVLYYQPQINLNTMKVYGMEVLLRWAHPELGILSPMYFIDIIEQNEMINPIGRFVIYESCKQIKKLNDMGYDDLKISVNISQKQLKDNSFLKFVYYVLKQTGVQTKNFHFEITERIMIDPTSDMLNSLTELKNMGIKIYIDDFGTEYSSLRYLYDLPIDGIKIDKSFVDKIQNSKKNMIITKNIVKLAQDLNLDVIAEGVEKKEQLSSLININCSKVQGFFFAKPINFEGFIDFLKKFNK